MILRFVVALSLPVCFAQSSNQQRMLDAYHNLPLYFEANQGQSDAQVKFLSHSADSVLFLTTSEALLRLPGPTSTLLRMRVEGGNPEARVSGLEKLPGESNYFFGNDSKQWQTGVPHFARVSYERVYPGVDMVYYFGNQRQLEFDFVVAPGANPEIIHMSFEGARPSLDAQGDLLLEGPSTPIRLQKPLIYQDVNGDRKQVAGRFVLDSAQRISFAVGPYDKARSLVIDPVLSYSTYLAAQNATGAGIAVDAAGNAYVTGNTGGYAYLTVNPIQPDPEGTRGAFIAKLNPAGTALIYSTTLSGTKTNTFFTPNSRGIKVAADNAGNAYVVGLTDNTDFPTTPGAIQRSLSGGEDLFITKLNSTGSALLYSTYLGGSLDEALGFPSIAVDTSGNAYVTGGTDSRNFPVTGGVLQPRFGGGDGDAFVAKLNATGTTLLYSTYLGGSSSDFSNDIAVDTAGNAYVAGGTDSVNFPSTSGALQTAFKSGGRDGFVSKLNATGTALLYSTYLGGGGFDLAFGIAGDSGGNAYVTGVTSSTDFPTTALASQRTFGGGTQGFLSGDVFVSKVNPTGTSLIYSTYLGGNRDELALGIAVDASGAAYLTGQTNSANFPVTADAFQTGFGLRTRLYDGLGGLSSAAFLTKLNSTGTAVAYSTLFGGNNDDFASGIALGPSNTVYLTGGTGSFNFPRTLGVYEPDRGTDFHTAFVAKFDLSAGNSMSLATVVNAASYVPHPQGVVSPGQIAVLFGNGIGPSTLVGLRLNPAGLVDTSLAGVRVLFDGIPAPLLYASARQTSVVVPYALAGKIRTVVQVEYQGQRSNPLVLWVGTEQLGIFTTDSSGTGQAAVLNQDGIPNSASNRAEKGSIVVLFATGEGQTVPPGVDGKLALTPLPRPLGEISAVVDGLPAEVLYAGAAPGLVAGVLQVNVRIPASVRSGAAIPIFVIGQVTASEPVTIAIR